MQQWFCCLCLFHTANLSYMSSAYNKLLKTHLTPAWMEIWFHDTACKNTNFCHDTNNINCSDDRFLSATCVHHRVRVHHKKSSRNSPSGTTQTSLMRQTPLKMMSLVSRGAVGTLDQKGPKLFICKNTAERKKRASLRAMFNLDIFNMS